MNLKEDMLVGIACVVLGFIGFMVSTYELIYVDAKIIIYLVFCLTNLLMVLGSVLMSLTFARKLKEEK